VQVGQQLDHREAEAGALELSGEAAVDLAEGPEQLLETRRRDADAAVGDADLEELLERILRERERATCPGAVQA
jgi:hypothetical protein